MEPQEELAKVADHEGALKNLQQLRDACEQSGDLEGAGLYSSAISLMVHAKPGGADAEAEETPAEEKAESPEEEASERAAGTEAHSAEKTDTTDDLAKAGKVFSGKNSNALHTAARGVLQRLADGGDEKAKKMLEASDAHDEESAKEDEGEGGEEAKKTVGRANELNKTDPIVLTEQLLADILDDVVELTEQVYAAELHKALADPGNPLMKAIHGDLAKSATDQAAQADNLKKVVGDMGTIVVAVQALQKRFDAFQAQGQIGPTVREFGAPIQFGELEATPDGLEALKKAIDTTTDPAIKWQLGQLLSKQQILVAQKSGQQIGRP